MAEKCLFDICRGYDRMYGFFDILYLAFLTIFSSKILLMNLFKREVFPELGSPTIPISRTNYFYFILPSISK